MNISSKHLLVCPWTLINSLSPEYHCQGSPQAWLSLQEELWVWSLFWSFICCQQFLLLDKWAVIPHLPSPWSGLVLQTLIVDCLFSRLRNPRLFLFLKFLKYIPPCSLNIVAIPPHLWSPLLFFWEEENLGICMCVVRSMCVVRKKKKRDPKESFCIRSELEVAREERIYRVV